MSLSGSEPISIDRHDFGEERVFLMTRVRDIRRRILTMWCIAAAIILSFFSVCLYVYLRGHKGTWNLATSVTLFFLLPVSLILIGINAELKRAAPFEFRFFEKGICEMRNGFPARLHFWGDLSSVEVPAMNSYRDIKLRFGPYEARIRTECFENIDHFTRFLGRVAPETAAASVYKLGRGAKGFTETFKGTYESRTC